MLRIIGRADYAAAAGRTGGDSVIAIDGTDVTEAFEKGAQRTLIIAQQVGAEVIVLKSR